MVGVGTDDAGDEVGPTARLRSLFDVEFDPFNDDWALRPSGVLRACRAAVAEGDRAFLDDLADSAFLDSIDAEHVPGAPVVERAHAIVACARLALWDGADPAFGLELVRRALAAAPPGSGEGLRLAVAAEPGPVTGDQPGLDLLRALATSPPGLPVEVLDLFDHLRGHPPAAIERSVDVAFPCSTHAAGQLAILRVTRAVDGRPGLTHDVVDAPFQRVDASLVGALERAWAVAGTPPASLRWRIVSSQTGHALPAVVGPSIGLGAAVAVLALAHGRPGPRTDRWAFTGDLDQYGRLRSLLDGEADLAAYRAKLMASGERTFVFPRPDHDELSSLPAVTGQEARLSPAATVAEVEQRLVDWNGWWRRWSDEPFVGRSDQIDVLEEGWRRAAGAGPAFTLVHGGAGVGKTRLAAEVGRRLAVEGATVLYGACNRRSSISELQPVTEAFIPLVTDTEPAELARQLGQHVEDLARWTPELADHLGIERPRPVTELADAFRLLITALRHWIGQVARTGPVLWVLDDAQWAHPRTLTLVEEVLRTPQPLALHLVVLVNDDEEESEELAEFLAAMARLPGHSSTALELGGLSQAETGDLVRAELAQSSPIVVERAVEALWRSTVGHPLFLVELLANEASTTPTATHRTSGRRLDRVRAVMAAKLARLSPPARRLVEVAAVSGTSVTLAVAGRATGMDEDTCLAGAEEAVGARLLAELPGDTDQVAFFHGLTRDVLLEGLSDARRRRLHRDVGLALEELGVRGSLSRATELAFHFGESSGLGPDEAAKAVRYGLEAARAAAARYAYGTAVDCLRRAVSAAARVEGADARQRGELHVELGELYNRADEVDAGRDAFREAASEARAIGDPKLLARAAIGFGGPIPVNAEDPEAIALLEEARRRLPPEPSSERARVLGRLAHWRFHSGSRAEKLALADEAVAMATALDDPSTLATVLADRYWALYAPSDVRQRLDTAQQIVALGRRLDDPELELQGLHCAIHVLFELGEVTAGQRAREDRDQLATSLRLEHYGWVMEVNRALDAALVGTLETAEKAAHDALAVGRHTDEAQAKVVFGAQLTMIRWLQGDFGDQLPFVTRMHERFPGRPIWTASLAWLSAETGDLERSATCVAELAPADLDDLFDRFESWAMLACLSQAAVALDDAELAAELYRRFEPHAALVCMVGQSANYGAVAHHLGRLAQVMGRPEDADRHFAAAHELHTRLGSPPLVAITEAAWAGLLAPSQPERARELARRATATAIRLGLHGVDRQARAVLDALGSGGEGPYRSAWSRNATKPG